jgi:glycerophosphoryl diester phosphodiesterase
MRKILENQIADKSRPLVMAHRGGFYEGRENSSVGIRENFKYNPDILEIDVKKSIDGVLFCYHGTILTLLTIGFLPYKFIKRFIPYVETLEEILATIASLDASVIVYLDIKSASIKPADLKGTLKKFSLSQVWIAAYTFRKLQVFRKSLGEDCVYIFNRPALWLGRAIKAAQGVADVIQLFPYQWRAKNVEHARRSGVEVAYFKSSSRTFKSYLLAKQYGSVWFAFDTVAEAQKYITSYNTPK